jgi:DNA repair exonuclease SbcCD ATPase subunit
MRAFLLCLVVVAAVPAHAENCEVAKEKKQPSAEMRYILARADGTLTISGSLDDIPYAKSLQQKYGQPVLVFQEGGRLYLILEKDVIARVEEVTRRSEPMDRRRQELEKRRERVDKLEEAASDRLERAEGEIDRAHDSGDKARARELKPQLNAAKEELRQLQPAQREIEVEERALDEKRDQLGAEIDAAVQQVAREAIAKGTAIKVR